MSTGIGDIMHQEEIKELITKLVKLNIRDFASPMWFKQD